ncbi:hypothetical protein [Streptomyces sp. NL15-2K]|uniref:hypothetical protein n=1 Tax=Streptomyces sp. NL15-2K TaxID=376149 RepID=UPI000F567309|nr:MULTISPECIES: hypothetical protein [Actinomycetes]WKX08212.1 hypothetical protein Q4V64_12245 [Kutzneria buriramensis]
MTTISYPPKPSPADRIAVISPGAGLPELFPRPFELGLERLHDDYGLIPVEYPTTRKMGTTPRERADDRPKTWPFEHPNSPEGGARYAAEQREAVLRAMRAYAPDTTIVFDVDYGHTDPQLVIPYGGTVRVDGPARRIKVAY